EAMSTGRVEVAIRYARRSWTCSVVVDREIARVELERLLIARQDALAHVALLQVEHAHLAFHLRQRLDAMERLAESLGEANERLELDERVLEMVPVRVDDRRDHLAADLVEEDEVRVHRPPVADGI